MQDTKQVKPEPKDKKLTLKVRSLETLETRAAPNTACPEDWGAGKCCRGTMALSAKLTAVAYF